MADTSFFLKIDPYDETVRLHELSQTPHAFSDATSSSTLTMPLLVQNGVEIIAQDKSWAGMDDITSVDVQQSRFKPTEAAPTSDGTSATQAHVGLGTLDGILYFCDINLKLAFVAKLLVRQQFMLASWLAPFLLLEKVLVATLAYTDASIRKQRRSLIMSSRFCLWLLHEIYIAVLIVAFHGFELLCAYRVAVDPERHSIPSGIASDFASPAGSIIMRGPRSGQRPPPPRGAEEAKKDAGPQLRLDSHYTCIIGAPFVVASVVQFFEESDVLYGIVAVSSLTTLVVGAVNFDHLASGYVRASYASPGRLQFTVFHCMLRISEITSRFGILVALWLCFPDHHLLIDMVGVLDYCFGVMAFCWSGRWQGEVRGLTGVLSIVLLGAPIWVYDLSRYVDEIGLALPARRLTRSLNLLRGLELLTAVFLIGQHGSDSAGSGNQDDPLLPYNLSPRVLVALLLLTAVFNVLLRMASKVGDDFFTAVERGDVHVLEAMLRREGGIDTKICDWSERTALHMAAERGKLECLQRLIGAGASLDLGDVDLRTALHLAAAKDQLACVRLLVSSGADHQALDNKYENPLHVACRSGNLGVAQILLNATAAAPHEDCEDCSSAQLFQTNIDGQRPHDLLPASAAASPLATFMREQQEDGSSLGTCSVALGRRRSSCGDANEASFVHDVVADEVDALFGEDIANPVRRGIGNSKPTKKPGLSSYVFSKGVGPATTKILDYMHQRAAGHKIPLCYLRRLDMLGRGGFGKVIKVQDVRSEVTYALKLQDRNWTTKQAVAEVMALKSVSDSTYIVHAYIVNIYQIFRTREYYCILMELCSMDLNMYILTHRDVAKGLPGLTEQRAARYTSCIVLALEFLHGRRMIFRDLKPENILIQAQRDHAKLADFGLARSVRAIIASGFVEEDNNNRDRSITNEVCDTPQALTQMAGTRAFMASEAFGGAAGFDDSWSEERKMQWLASRDWYALGCCLLLMLLGEAGGRLVHNVRPVLLPPSEEEIPSTLRLAVRRRLIDKDAFELTSSLTSPRVDDRGGPKEMRQSPFLQDALATMELEAARCLESADGEERSYSCMEAFRRS